ncbi:MAG: FAD-dependent pyridine nucleotide-disulfide oxidoreductase [Chitinophagaceae bacterium]|nr:FAD-dependent pyridine nucleotide-disulfide oxidoreductase [Chitinophagaceae bacterium]
MESRTGLSLNIPVLDKPRVVIIGGGFGGINTVKNLRNKGFQIVLFDKHNYHTFQPLLYQVATAGLQPDSIAGPLRNIFKGHDDFHFRLFKITAIDPDRNIVSTEAGDLSYDYLVIAGGSRPNFFGNQKIEQYSLPLKSIPDALNLRSQFMQVLEQAEMTNDATGRKALLTIVLVGGGPTGVDTAGALAELKKHILPKDYPALDFNEMKIYLVEGVNRLLPQMSEKAGARAKRDLEKLGVIVWLNTMVLSYDGKTIFFKDQDPIDTSTVVWSAGVTSAAFPGLRTEWLEKGRILIDENCRVIGAKNIFAIGDISLMKTAKYPKGHPGVAQVAIQMGKYVGINLAKLQESKPMNAFAYFDKGALATIGRGKAVADLPGNIRFGGRLAWWIWLFVHINYLISFRNKLLVFASWIWNYFTYDKGNRLIIRPYSRKDVLPVVDKAHSNKQDETKIL